GSLTLSYSAVRPWTEYLRFTLRSDLQQIVTLPGNDDVITLSINGANVGHPLVFGSTNVDAFPGTDYFNGVGGGIPGTPMVDRRGLVVVKSTHPPNVAYATVDHLVDGNLSADEYGSTQFQNSLTDLIITFDFTPTGTPQIIDAFTWLQSNTTSQGTYAF